MDTFKLKPSYIARRLREKITDTSNMNFVITYPRSGRNWSRNMVTDCGVPNFKEKVFDFDTLAKELSSKNKIIFGHDVADFPFIQRLSPENPARDFIPQRYKGKKIFLVVRNPIDVAISHYHWLRYNEDRGEPVGTYPMDIDEFVLSPEFGVAKIAAFHALWKDFLQNGGLVSDYLIYDYDDIKADAGKYLRTMFNFFGFDISDETIKSAVDKNSAAKAKQDKDRTTRAGIKLSVHGDEKVSDAVMAQLKEMIAQPAPAFYSQGAKKVA